MLDFWLLWDFYDCHTAYGLLASNTPNVEVDCGLTLVCVHLNRKGHRLRP